MVKKALLILFTFGFMSGHLWAAPVTAEQAAQKAKRFMAAKKGSVELNRTAWQEVAASRGEIDDTAPLLYVFNVGKDEGFIIVSGEDSTPEVLAYTEQGSYDYAQLPDNARAWIDSYARQIEELRQNHVEAAADEVEIYDAIAPLLTCRWTQNAPYNNSCPIFVNNQRSVTGCVAAAMAQVLYHHRAKSVSALQATIPAYLCNSNWTAGQVSVSSFAAGSIVDWNNMLDAYTGATDETQKKAVADLMAYCGASVEVDYRDALNGGSSASETGVPEALKKYFGYAETAVLKYRKHFTTDNWDRLIYRELMNGRPVIFSGQDIQIINGEEVKYGHSFVCDGYDNGYFHFNWGWGGLSDGYYLISDLCPTDQGIGGKDGRAYNADVTAVIGLKPGDGTPYEEPLRLTVIDFDLAAPAQGEFKFECRFQNRTTSTRSFDYVLAACQNGQVKGLLNTIRRENLSKNTTKILTLSGPDAWWAQKFAAGTYQVKLLCRLSDAEGWEEPIDADKWYMDVTIGGNRQISYVLHQYEEPEVELGLDPDGVNDPKMNTHNFNGIADVYTLTGVKVASGVTTLQGLPAGVYVVQGRKVVVR